MGKRSKQNNMAPTSQLFQSPGHKKCKNSERKISENLGNLRKKVARKNELVENTEIFDHFEFQVLSTVDRNSRKQTFWIVVDATLFHSDNEDYDHIQDQWYWEHMGSIERTSVFEHVQNAHIQITLPMCKVTSGSLLSIHTFCIYSIQWFC